MYAFKIESGLVHLSDPCYNIGTWCGQYNVPAKNGDWEATVEYSDGGRVASFSAYNVGPTYSPHRMPTTQTRFDIGVDSGQFGIFDAEIYDPESDYESPGFYRDCCDATLARAGAGAVQDKGFVSRTGWGDGSYECVMTKTEDGELVGIDIVFIYDEVDFEEEDEDWED
jgi:hypothetical protein